VRARSGLLDHDGQRVRLSPVAHPGTHARTPWRARGASGGRNAVACRCSRRRVAEKRVTPISSSLKSQLQLLRALLEIADVGRDPVELEEPMRRSIPPVTRALLVLREVVPVWRGAGSRPLEALRVFASRGGPGGSARGTCRRWRGAWRAGPAGATRRPARRRWRSGHAVNLAEAGASPGRGPPVP